MGTHLSGPFKSQQINNVSFLKGVMSELNLGGGQGGRGGGLLQLQDLPPAPIDASDEKCTGNRPT